MVYKYGSAKMLRLTTLGIVIGSLLFLSACNVRPPAHNHDHSAPGFTDYTGPQEGVWPPQPRGISNTQKFVSAELSGALTSELESRLIARLEQKTDVQEALGSDYVYLQSERMTPKGEAPRNLAIFYSYSKNQTVEVSELNEGDTDIRTFSPEAYQPPEGEKEVEQAVKLAKVKLLEGGFSEVQRLGGGALLAFAGGAAGESGFFRSRVLYVTFASGPDTLPEYFAYVDLTNKSVLEHGPIN